MIKNTHLICIGTLVFSLFARPVLADIYKHTDANGVVTYSNLKSKDAIVNSVIAMLLLKTLVIVPVILQDKRVANI